MYWNSSADIVNILMMNLLLRTYVIAALNLITLVA
jgi:hypothetical protein